MSKTAFQLDCMTGQLASALAAANTVTDHGIKYPILKATRIAVDGQSAWVYASNSNQAIRARIAANGSGVVHLDTAALTTKITALKQTAPVSIAGDDKSVTITQGRTRWKLPVLANPDYYDFEASAAALDGEPVEISAGALQAALAAVRPAFSTDESRYYLSGACIELSAGRFRVVATDGNVLAAVQIPGKFPARDIFLMPPGSTAAIARLFEADDTLQMVSTPDAFTLDNGDTFFRSKNIEGTFPSWERIIPKSTSSVEVDGAEFLAALERVAAIREDMGKQTRFVAVEMLFGESEITMTSQNKDGEAGEDYCACERTSGEHDFHVAFSSDTLATALRTFGAVDGLKICFSNTKRKNSVGVTIDPIVIHRAVSDGDDFRVVNVLIESKGELA